MSLKPLFATILVDVWKSGSASAIWQVLAAVDESAESGASWLQWGLRITILLDEGVIYTLDDVVPSVIGVSFDSRPTSNVLLLFYLFREAASVGFRLFVVIGLIVGLRRCHLTLSVVVIIEAISHVRKNVRESSSVL